MRILVTGGAGFIGSHFVRRLLAGGDDRVTILDALTYAGGLDTIADLVADDRVDFVEGDVADAAAVRGALPGHDVVVNFAAESHVDRSLGAPASFATTNCTGTAVLCEAAVRLGVERFVQVSTDEVYGSVDVGSSDESAPLAPSSAYSASKAGADLLALAAHATSGLPVVVVRSSNNYGPNQHPEKLIPMAVIRLLAGETVPLYGDGENVREWIHVADNCAAIETVARAGEPGAVYNVGGGVGVSNIDVVGRLAKLCGRDLDAYELVADRPGHDRRYSLDSARVHALGWRPEVDLDDGLERTVAWYRENRTWWQSRRRTSTGTPTAAP